MRVALSRKADADLDGILDYGIAVHGRDVAEAYLRSIHVSFDRLAEYPELEWHGLNSRYAGVAEVVAGDNPA